MKDFKV